MQIKIVGCSRKTYWYAKHIGEVFDVVDEDTTDYYVNYAKPDEYSISCMVLKSDAEVVNENNDRCYETACMRNNVTLQPGDYVCTKGMTQEQYYAVVSKFMAAGVDQNSYDYSYAKYAGDGVVSYLGWDSRDDELWDCRHVAARFDGRGLTVEQVLGSEFELGVDGLHALQTLIASAQADVLIYWNTSEQKIKYQVFTADEEEMETDDYDEVVEVLEAYAKIRAITNRNKRHI